MTIQEWVNRYFMVEGMQVFVSGYGSYKSSDQKIEFLYNRIVVSPEWLMEKLPATMAYHRLAGYDVVGEPRSPLGTYFWGEPHRSIPQWEVVEGEQR